MPSNLPPLFGKNSLLALGLKVFDEQHQGQARIGKVGAAGAQRIVDFAAKDGLTFQESRSLALLSKDNFTFNARGQEVVDQFLAANPVPPPADGPERVSRTERVANRVASDGKVSFQDVTAIRDTFSRIDATPWPPGPAGPGGQGAAGSAGREVHPAQRPARQRVQRPRRADAPGEGLRRMSLRATAGSRP